MRVCSVGLASVGLFFSSISSMAGAAGLGINEHSASTMGTAYAGRASHGEDASIGASNPAGISFLDRPQVTLGATVVLEGGNFENGKFTAPPPAIGVPISGDDRDFLKTTAIPFGHYATPINDQFSFGLNIYAPFGINLDYSDTFPGRFFGLKTKLETINYQGTFAYKLRENLSFGVGLVASHASGELTQKKFTGLGLDVDAKVKGSDTQYTWNIGALWQPLPGTTLGLAYHAKTDFKLSGQVEVSIAQLPMSSFKHDAKLDVTLPESVALSATQVVNDQWTVMADVTWVGWSTLKEIRVVDKEATRILNGNNYVPLDWRNTWAFSVGTAYHMTHDWTLRAGYMYEQTPTSDSVRTVRVPDNDRHWLTAGARWDASKDLSFDLSAAYVMLKDGTIDEKDYNTEEKVDPDGGEFTGDYKNQKGWLLSGQATYRF